MKHSVPLGMIIVIFALGAAPLARAQDSVRYIDRKSMKETTASGSIQEESPSQIAIKSGAASTTKEIPALEVFDVVYDVPGAVKLTYRSASSDERKAMEPATKDADRKKALADSLKGYEEIVSKLAGGKYKFAERHLQYKVARLLARQAEDDPALTDRAIEALEKFTKAYPDGWQISAAAKLLARLQVAKGDTAAARKTYEGLAAVPNLPPVVRQECDFLAADALIQGKQYTEAEKKLQGLLGSIKSDDPQALRVRIYLAQCQGASGKLAEAVKQLEGIIAATTDKNMKALAYNALGDSYRLQGRGKDAIWPYLWVDVIYHQDREEHIKAMEHLAKLFDEQGDAARAKEYRDLLKRETNK